MKKEWKKKIECLMRCMILGIMCMLAGSTASAAEYEYLVGELEDSYMVTESYILQRSFEAYIYDDGDEDWLDIPIESYEVLGSEILDPESGEYVEAPEGYKCVDLFYDREEEWWACRGKNEGRAKMRVYYTPCEGDDANPGYSDYYVYVETERYFLSYLMKERRVLPNDELYIPLNGVYDTYYDQQHYHYDLIEDFDAEFSFDDEEEEQYLFPSLVVDPETGMRQIKVEAGDIDWLEEPFDTGFDMVITFVNYKGEEKTLSEWVPVTIVNESAYICMPEIPKDLVVSVNDIFDLNEYGPFVVRKWIDDDSEICTETVEDIYWELEYDGWIWEPVSDTEEGKIPVLKRIETASADFTLNASIYDEDQEDYVFCDAVSFSLQAVHGGGEYPQPGEGSYYYYLTYDTPFKSIGDRMSFETYIFSRNGEMVNYDDFTYLWYKDGELIPDANGPVYTIESIKESDFGTYLLIVPEAEDFGNNVTIINDDDRIDSYVKGPESVAIGDQITLTAELFDQKDNKLQNTEDFLYFWGFMEEDPETGYFYMRDSTDTGTTNKLTITVTEENKDYHIFCECHRVDDPTTLLGWYFYYTLPYNKNGEETDADSNITMIRIGDSITAALQDAEHAKEYGILYSETTSDPTIETEGRVRLHYTQREQDKFYLDLSGAAKGFYRGYAVFETEEGEVVKYSDTIKIQ